MTLVLSNHNHFYICGQLLCLIRIFLWGYSYKLTKKYCHVPISYLFHIRKVIYDDLLTCRYTSFCFLSFEPRYGTYCNYIFLYEFYLISRFIFWIVVFGRQFLISYFMNTETDPFLKIYIVDFVLHTLLFFLFSLKSYSIL